MTKPPDRIGSKLKDLRKAFMAQVPERVKAIEKIWTALLRDGWDLQRAKSLAQELHTLAGTAGTFGLAGLVAAAKGWEAELREKIQDEVPPAEILEPSRGEWLAALKKAVEESGETPAAGRRVGVSSPFEPVPAAADNGTIFWVEGDPLLAESLAHQIRCYGYEVVTFTTLDALRKALRNTTPLLILMDIALPEGESAGGRAVARIHKDREKRIPVIFVSGRSDFDARLEAVRSGGDAYFTKPVDVGKLIQRFDTIAKRRSREPYRILVVDDEPLLAEYHAEILRQAGMIAAKVTDPRQVLRHLIDFRPELILMDIYMPGCNGIELAGVIRQDESYVDIPIVFLSAEDNLSRQLLAMSRGGDDFLTKPIQAAHLIASVTLRANRHRILRSFMLYDGLTGLLNHSRTKELVEIEITRAARAKSPLSFAVIDLDHFKAVNDTHGHPVGDQVLKSVAQLLKQRLRATDIVGRFGGEEFAVILPNTEGSTAREILNELRNNFAKILHLGSNGTFAVTFSCGVAAYEPGSAGAELIAEADQLLYQAKGAGRNQVVLAPAAGDDRLRKTRR